MNDLIKRLRAKATAHLPGGYKLCAEAADALEQMERDFREYIDRQVHRSAGVYACYICKDGHSEWGSPNCRKDSCDGVSGWEWGRPHE